MRKFTEKDITGLSRAFQTFMGAQNGQRVNVGRHRRQLERAIAEGITIDELLNTGNYARVEHALGKKPSLEEYVDSLVNEKVLIMNYRAENGWDFDYIAEVFHDFFLELRPKGGTWSTQSAKMNLQKLVSRNTLQGIMSNELIEKVSEATGRGDELTCFQYVEMLLAKKDDEEPVIDNSLTEEQAQKMEERQSMAVVDLEAEAREENDADIPPAGEKMAEINDQNFPEEPFSPEIGYAALPAPREFKRVHIAEALRGLTIAEFVELSKIFDEGIYIDEMIDRLTDGDFNKNDESTMARNAHMSIKSSLFPHFLECAAWQGVDISETTAMNMDLLSMSWDMRDPNTRKLQKLRELVYSQAINNAEDADLIDVIQDLEKFYASIE